MKITYESNGQTVGDGIRVTRVSGGGQKLEVLVDVKTERWSALALVGDAAPGPVTPPPVEEPEEPPTGPGSTGNDSPNGTTIDAAGESLTFAGKVYSLIDVTGQGLGIAVNGGYLTETNNVAAMFVHEGKLFQQAHGLYWERTQFGWGETIGRDPRLPPEVPVVNPPPIKDDGAGTPPSPEPWMVGGEMAFPRIAYSEGETIYVPPGQRYAYIPIDADRHPIHANYSLFGNVRNVNGGGINVGGGAGWMPPFAIVWRTGDDARHYVTIDMQQGRSAGNKVEALFTTQGGGWRGDSTIGVTIEIRDGAVNALPATMPKHRAPFRLNLDGATAAADQDMAKMVWSDTGFEGNVKIGTPGAKPCWLSRLSHGYSQQGNGETGAYLNSDKFPGDAINPHSKGTDAQGRPFVRLHTQKIPKQVDVGPATGKPAGQETYIYQASMLCGQYMDAFCRRRGIFRAQFTSADRRYSWPAFWAIGRWFKSAERWAAWPPEFDFFPMLNVAVKTPDRNDAYDQGSGDMLIYGIQGYDLGSGYKLEPYTAAQPWKQAGRAVS